MQFKSNQRRVLCAGHWLRLVLGVFLLFFFSGSAIAQVEVWTRQFGSIAPIDLNNGFGSEVAEAVGADSQGNVLVAGRTSGTFPGESDFTGSDDAYLRKYDSVGNVVWTRQFGTSDYETSACLAVDAGGNVYVAANTGFSDFDMTATLYKYGPTGAQLWAEPLGSGAQVASIAVDSSGYAYVVGSAIGLRKFDPNGNLAWARQLSSNLNPASVAVDPGGNDIYVGGNVLVSDSVQRINLRRYTSLGVEVSNVSLLPQLSAFNAVESMTLDSSGLLYIAGWIAGGQLGSPVAGSADAFLARLDPSGFVLWARLFGTSSDDFINSVAVAPDGVVYVGGETGGAPPGEIETPANSVFLRKYRIDGELLWTDQFGTSDYDLGGFLAIDSANNVYISGGTSGTLPGELRPASDTERNTDAFLRKYGAPVEVVTHLTSLVPTLGLDAGNQNALNSLLSAIKASLGIADNTPAINQLSAFTQYLEALARSGRLSPLVSESLIDAAQRVSNALQ